jgi:hypothetical protein
VPPRQLNARDVLLRAFVLHGMGQTDKAAKRVREIYPRSHDDWGGADYLLEVTQALAIAGRNTLALDWLDDYLSGSGVYSTLIVIKELPAFSRLVGGTGIFRPR